MPNETITPEKEAAPPAERTNAPDRHAANGQGSSAAPETDPQAPPGEQQGDGDKEKMSPRRKLVLGAIAAIVLLAGGFYGVRYYLWGKVHVSTDDAYVTGNLVNVSPLIGGTLSRLTVEEGDTVRRGELIARLDDGGQQAALRQARAAYQAALSQIPQARTNLTYQRQATEAAIRRARAAVSAQQARTKGANAQVTLASGTTRNQVAQARSEVAAAQAQADQVAAQARTAQAAVTGYRQAVQTARRGVDALQARIRAAQADVEKTGKDEARYARLQAQEAVTPQQYDTVHAQAESARAQLASLEEQVAQARSQVAQAQANVAQAEAQRAASGKAAEAAREQVGVAQAGVALARAGAAQVGIQASNLAATAAESPQAEADLETALAGRTQIALKRQQVATAEAQAQQAAAALKSAQIQENDTYIYAPADGTVVRKTANVGASLSPGQTVVTITQGQRVWVTANFKETQLTDVRVGQPVALDVDAFPGKHFRGRVDSINEATGAATSLLPPDNATGNFTKVVQRIPIKIALVPRDAVRREEYDNDEEWATTEDIEMLRQGMSVNATIDTHDKTVSHPERVPAATKGNQPADNNAQGGGAATSDTGTPASTPGGAGTADVSSGAANGSENNVNGASSGTRSNNAAGAAGGATAGSAAQGNAPSNGNNAALAVPTPRPGAVGSGGEPGEMQPTPGVPAPGAPAPRPNVPGPSSSVPGAAGNNNAAGTSVDKGVGAGTGSGSSTGMGAGSAGTGAAGGGR